MINRGKIKDVLVHAFLFVVCPLVCLPFLLDPFLSFAQYEGWSFPAFSASSSGSAVSASAVSASPVVSGSFSGSCFDLARSEAIQQGIDPDLYARQINQESGCQPNVCSSAGACGVAQLMPATASGLGVNPFDEQASLWAGAHLMAGYLRLYGGDWAKALACYNAGSGAVAYAIATYGASWYAYMPLETQHYILVILGHF
jgi:soluble lytic murein transglycosylase-like protein